MTKSERKEVLQDWVNYLYQMIPVDEGDLVDVGDDPYYNPRPKFEVGERRFIFDMEELVHNKGCGTVVCGIGALSYARPDLLRRSRVDTGIYDVEAKNALLTSIKTWHKKNEHDPANLTARNIDITEIVSYLITGDPEDEAGDIVYDYSIETPIEFANTLIVTAAERGHIRLRRPNNASRRA